VESGKGSLHIVAGHGVFTEVSECLTVRLTDTASCHHNNGALQLFSGSALFSLWQCVHNVSSTADILRNVTCRICSGRILPDNCSKGTLPLCARPSSWFDESHADSSNSRAPSWEIPWGMSVHIATGTTLPSTERSEVSFTAEVPTANCVHLSLAVARTASGQQCCQS